MGIIAAGIAVAAGAAVSAYGTSQAASAQKKAAGIHAGQAKKNAAKQTERLEVITKEKTAKLDDIQNTLERTGGGASLQSQENLDLLRKAQNDYLKLGAGDFSAFEDQLKDVMSSTVANSFGAGSPVGSFTQLSAQNIMQLRQQGLNTGLQASAFIGGEIYNQLGAEFSVLDQEFQTQNDIDNNRVGQVSAAVQQRADQQGAGTMATGSALTSIGSALATYGVSSGAIGGDGGGQTDVASYGVTASSRPNLSNGTVLSGGGGGGGYANAAALALPAFSGVVDPPPPSPYGQHPANIPPIPQGYQPSVLPPIGSTPQESAYFGGYDQYSGQRFS